jgi:anti-sigma factor RsiW
MNCEQTRHLLDAYLDGELDLVRNLEIEQHLSECNECPIIYRNRQTLRAAMTDETFYFSAPTDLHRRIQRSLREADKSSLPRRLPFQRWMIAAAALLIIGISVGAVWKTLVPSTDERLAAEVLSSHVRSLMANHLEDIASTDQHTVKPWFDGKLDFSPPVVDLTSQGFPLIGGRLDYIDNHPVAALVYQRRKHVINVFIWPKSNGDPTAPLGTSRQGYEVLHWTQSSMSFWAVSDVSSDDLQTLKQQLQSQIAAPSGTQGLPS